MKKNIMPFVICTHNDDCDDLERLKIYQTLALTIQQLKRASV
jgi:hypothetical protein